jgi:excisionase family DNA binding protein
VLVASRDGDDPYRLLADALGAIVRDAVQEGVRIGVQEGVRVVLSEVHLERGDNATLVSVLEAASRLGLGRSKVNELIASGDLPSILVGTRRLLRPADLEAFAANQSNGG